MEVGIYLIPVGILFGIVVLGALFWSIKSGQYDDLDKEASRILYDDDGLYNHNIDENQHDKK